MVNYEKIFEPYYEGGWEAYPLETTLVTAGALNAYDAALMHIEDYLDTMVDPNDNLAETYSDEATYEVGDYCVYNGVLYKCITAIDEAEEFDLEKWDHVLVTDEMGSGGGGGTTVIANPVGEPTDDLETIQIGNTIYDIPGGGGGNANIWTGTQAELEEVFDELEEGTQINITDDEQEVVEGGTIYSEDEQVIGLWTDNRPLYQKTYNVTFSSDAYAITIPSEIDIKTIIGGVDSANKTDFIHIGYGGGSSDSVQAYRSDATTLRFQNKYYSQRPNGEITIQYTKTTDAPLDAVVGKKTMYIASSDCYSTEEKEIGCWHNGKPLYQRTYVFTNPITCASQTWTTLTEATASNVEEIVSAGGQDANGTRFDALGCNFSNGAFGILQTRNTTITLKKFTVQYTKSTDTAGSGQYTPASGKAVHYSTDEEVIGTFLGETLYRKVIPITESWNFVANTWVKSNIPKGDIKAIVNGRIEIFYQDTYSLHFVQLGIVDNMIAGNSFRQFAAAANGANLILEYTKSA